MHFKEDFHWAYILGAYTRRFGFLNVKIEKTITQRVTRYFSYKLRFYKFHELRITNLSKDVYLSFILKVGVSSNER